MNAQASTIANRPDRKAVSSTEGDKAVAQPGETVSTLSARCGCRGFEGIHGSRLNHPGLFQQVLAGWNRLPAAIAPLGVHPRLALAKWAFHKVDPEDLPANLSEHTSGETDASVTEGQHQEDIARWGSPTESLNPERKQAVPV